MPSPLATEKAGLIRIRFQIDGSGLMTAPSINEELPELSNPDRLAKTGPCSTRCESTVQS